MQRIDSHGSPREGIRLREQIGAGATLGKVLVPLPRSRCGGRVTVLLGESNPRLAGA